MHVPQHWFNAYEGNRKPNESRSADAKANEVREGDLFLHFAGNKKLDRESRMRSYLELQNLHRTTWEVPVGQLNLTEEIKDFWDARKSKMRHTSAIK